MVMGSGERVSYGSRCGETVDRLIGVVASCCLLCCVFSPSVQPCPNTRYCKQSAIVPICLLLVIYARTFKIADHRRQFQSASTHVPSWGQKTRFSRYVI